MNLFIVLVLSIVFLLLITILTWAIFGRLIWLQFKRWTLASRGYVEVEHISPTKVRNYFIMKPSEHKFDIDGGFYHFISECITRKGDIIKKYDKDFLNKELVIDPSELEGLSDTEQEDYKRKRLKEFEEMKNIAKIISGLKYDPELLNRKMGMPVITYYADNPDPMNYAERNKVYGSGVIKDMYLRLLLTQRYKDFKMFVLIVTIALVVIGIANVGFYYNGQSLIKVNGQCLSQLNTCRTTCDMWVNNTLTAFAQRSAQQVVGGIPI